MTLQQSTLSRQTKNGLSGFLGDIRRGETVLITHRGTAVARMEPCRTSDLTADQAATELVRQGIVAPPDAALDVERLLATQVPRLPDGVSASQLIASERDHDNR